MNTQVKAEQKSVLTLGLVSIDHQARQLFKIFEVDVDRFLNKHEKGVFFYVDPNDIIHASELSRYHACYQINLEKNIKALESHRAGEYGHRVVSIFFINGVRFTVCTVLNRLFNKTIVYSPRLL